ncbi:M20/M25/M40 family metallo-hydrolase [Streptomyces sp. NPDC091280]|uniref:M20/M25/M40 family metallo-hydrolase n=1 Tax=Streptomyces sp. NPDC091280 TaxID=3365984 RepID=UPI00381ECE93
MPLSTRRFRLHESVRDAVATITAESAAEHVRQLTSLGPRDAHRPAAVDATLAHLTDCLASFGYKTVEERYGVGRHQTNVLATLPGQRADLPLLEIGAHWDTVPGSPGADDNASGIAGLLEIARCLQAAGPFPRGIRFCCFAEEESGLLGSFAHVERLDKGSVDGLISLEMIGFRTTAPASQQTPLRVPLLFSPPRVGDFITVVADLRSTSYADAFTQGAAQCARGLRVFSVRRIGGLLKDASRSDHLPYWRSRRKGLLVTDTANLRNQHYHRESDTIETLDFEFLADVARAAAGAAAILAR